MKFLIGVCLLISQVAGGPPAEWSCKSLSQTRGSLPSCVLSAKASNDVWYITTQKDASQSGSYMCSVPITGAGVVDTADFYLQGSFDSPTDMSFAGISFNTDSSSSGNFIYFRLKSPAPSNNFVLGNMQRGITQTQKNFDATAVQSGRINFEIQFEDNNLEVYLNGVRHSLASNYQPYYTEAGAFNIISANFRGANYKVSGLKVCTPVICIAPDGSSIKGGDSYTDSDGKKCTCKASGQMECVCDIPSSPCPGGTTRWTDPETCESKCVRGPQYCRSSGDPHYKSFDGKYYDFHGKCTYQAASCGEFEVYFKNYDLIGRAPRYTGRIELKFNGEVFSIENNYVAKVNGQQVQVPYVKTYTNGDRVEIINNGQLEIRLYNKGRNPSVRLRANNAGRYINAEMWLHGSCADLTEGLCGNFNGNPNDDLIQNNPNVHGETYKEYDESCPAPPKPYHPCDDIDNGHAQAEEICSVIKGSPFNQCDVDVGSADGGPLKDCMTDVCYCFIDKSCACDTLDGYATACLNKNPLLADVKNWRNKITFCPLECPAGLAYQAEAPVPQPTCLNKNPKQEGTERGCFCPAGKLLQDGVCVDADQCKCIHEGVFYKTGDKVIKEGECKVCSCLAGGEMNCEDMECPALNCDDNEIVAHKPDKCCGYCEANWVKAVNPDNKLNQGQNVALTCEIFAEGVFKRHITWYRNGKKITQGLSKNKKILQVKDAGKQDAGEYICQVEKDGKVGEAKFNVEVVLRDVDIIRAKSTDVDFIIGEKIELEVTKLDELKEIYWECNGKRVNKAMERFTVINKAGFNRLIIDPSRKTDAGSCTCIAVNKDGDEEREEIKLSAKEANVELTPIDTDVECKENKKGCRIGCEVDANGATFEKEDLKICKVVGGRKTECKTPNFKNGAYSITFGSNTPASAKGTYVCTAKINGLNFESGKINVSVV